MVVVVFFFFNDTATTEIYTLSLHDALPIFQSSYLLVAELSCDEPPAQALDVEEQLRVRVVRHSSEGRTLLDRKSTRLNSSHANISYAVFCLKKKTPAHTLYFSRGAFTTTVI